MENRVNFTKEMIEIIKSWKGKNFKSFIENDATNYVTIFRFIIDGKTYDLSNDYVAYKYPDNDIEELSCFNLIKVDNDATLETSVVKGKIKETILEERIENVYLMKEVEKEKKPSKDFYEFITDKAIIIKTDKKYYAFWRYIIFNTLELSICEEYDKILSMIKWLNDDVGYEDELHITERVLEKII